ARPAHLRGQRRGKIIAVQVEGGDDVELHRPQQHALRERVDQAILDDDVAARAGVADAAPRPGVYGLGTEGEARDLIAPVAERALGVLHDVALVHQRDGLAVVVDGVLDGLADQALRPLARNGLDAYA